MKKYFVTYFLRFEDGTVNFKSRFFTTDNLESEWTKFCSLSNTEHVLKTVTIL